MGFKASVIVSTYNQPEWLVKVLKGYEYQTENNFEIVIADDGSDAKTNSCIQLFVKNSNMIIKHVWQEDNGFQKTKILNKAIQLCESDYLIFTDGDCIPRKDFVEKHLFLRKKNCFLSGGYFKLPRHISKLILKEHIESKECFTKNWLLNQGLKKNFKLNKLTSSGLKEKLLNKFTTTKATFDGMNASGWKADILAVNGFDERMQ